MKATYRGWPGTRNGRQAAAERGGGALERVPPEPQGLKLEISAYRQRGPVSTTSSDLTQCITVQWKEGSQPF